MYGADNNPMSKKTVALWHIIRCRCPNCHKATIFSGLLSIKAYCELCGFGLGRNDIGDGAAYLTMCIVGTFVTIFALLFETIYSPPLYIHVLVWTPVVILSSIVLLRIFKAFLIAMEFENKILPSDDYKK